MSSCSFKFLLYSNRRASLASDTLGVLRTAILYIKKSGKKSERERKEKEKANLLLLLLFFSGQKKGGEKNRPIYFFFFKSPHFCVAQTV
jgi:hypothetical protein